MAPRRGALGMCVSMAANMGSLLCFHASFRSSGVDISSTPALNGSNERSLFKESKSAFLKTKQCLLPAFLSSSLTSISKMTG